MSYPEHYSDAEKRRLMAGRKLATPKPGEGLVITGMSGRFPNSDTTAEFYRNLMNKVDLCDDDDRRWQHTNEEIPRLSGKINKVDDFDNGFFGMHSLHCDSTCPMSRLLLERTIEALFDAGINPVELKGTNTGVFVGSCYSESEKMHFYEVHVPNSHNMLGCSRSMLANRISYTLQLNGPSFICDTACSSSFYALEHAYRSIRDGKCDMAIVGGSNLCYDRYTTLQFARLGVLNMNTGCRPFDEDASGYTRSEAIVVVILQKEKDSKRIYCHLVHSKSNVDGFKEMGITFPSYEDQKVLLDNIYEECQIDPSTMAFVEAHGTGTKVGDPEELKAIDDVFCANQRKTPLLLGSIKGNIGHTEPASGLCSLVKVIFGMDTGIIPPNIHYDNPRKDVAALLEGRFQVVTEPTKWPSNNPYAGINCFGFGGANVHCVVKRHEKEKVIKHDSLPRLVCFSGRIEASITKFQDYLQNNELDYEFIKLFHEIFAKKVENHLYRGYSILLPNQEIERSMAFCDFTDKPLYLCLGSAYNYQTTTLKELSKLEVFRSTVEKINKILDHNKINVNLTVDEPTNLLQKVLITVTLHLGIVDILKTLEITPTFIRGSSMGDFTCAYANGSLTMEEVLLATHGVSKLLIDMKKANNINNEILDVLKAILPDKPRQVNKIQYSKANTHGYASPEYFAFNILNPKLIAEAQLIEKNSVVISIDYQCKLHSKTKHIQFLKEDTNLEKLLGNIGKVYEAGYQPHIHKLYPEIQLPVSRGTPSLAPLVEWKHDKKFFVPLRHTRILKSSNEKGIIFNTIATDYAYLKGHVIDGRNLFPATGYLMAIFDFYAQLFGTQPDEMKVCFENVKYIRAANISKEIKLYMTITLDGNFEICESNTTVVTGRIYQIDHIEDCFKGTKDEDSKIPLMDQKDIYKEFRLRGYNYKGAFKAVHQIEANQGLIEWNGNWTTFLDNMLQLFIVQADTRHLMVPTGINRMVIDFKKFTNYVESLEGDIKLVPVEADNKLRCVRTKFLEINGLKSSAIARRRQIEQPVLESYKFCPNEFSTTIEESVRINLQIILEIKSVVDMRVLEFVKNQHPDIQPLSVHAVKVLADLPVVQPNIIIDTDKEFELPTGITVSLPGTTYESNNIVCICNNLLETDSLEKIGKILVDDGFIISIEDNANITLIENYNIFTKHQVQDKIIYLLQKKKKLKDPAVIDISDVENFNEWISKIKSSMKNEALVIYSQNNSLSGLLGFVNCLRREVSNIHISGFFIKDNAPKFNIQNEFYKTQYEKGLGINVYEDGRWGTYRHMLLAKTKMVKADHYFANTQVRGDLSSLKWIEGKLKPDEPGICENYYVAINFRDIMEATGKLPLDYVITTRMEAHYLQGLEFAGRLANGQRIMGLSTTGSMSNITQYVFKWEIPPEWTMEEAVTVPVVYATVLYALETLNDKRGKSILIHSGTGGIGQAAINVCTYYDFDIFVTVGNEEKKAFLLEHFPNLKANQIGNSRDTSFVQMVLNETNGRGVDVVLNSLAEEKLHASVKCLARGGYFLEIGKYDLTNNNKLNLDLLEKEASYNGIMLDLILNSKKENHFIHSLLRDALSKGIIKPLSRTVFEKDQLEESYRHMTTGKHIGKVLIKIRDEEDLMVKPKPQPDLAVPRYHCNSDMTYIIVGGLGGFGLELADWLILRGARNLLLTSRNGIKTGYQQFRINLWRSYGVKVVVSLEDIAIKEGCQKLLEEANNLAPVAGIFNLAVELKDALFENQTAEDFIASFRPKAYGTKHLDELTRRACPQLKQFVVFSSVSCGRGNPGQTNYGMSNSIMERICEQRKLEGLPALAVQWGAVGDVGLVADMQKEATEIAIGGTLQQRISGCLEVMDRLLRQDDPVVSSVVVAEKYGSNSADNMVDAVLNIIGLRDLKTISLHSSLAELGMDSMMAVEIKQTLERDFDVFLSPQDMRNLTFARLIEISDGKSEFSETGSADNLEETFKVMIGNFYSKDTYELQAVYTKPQNNSRKIVIFPGIEGSYLSMKSLCEHLNYSSMCVQYKANDNKTVESLTLAYWPLVKEYFSEMKEYIFIAHSYGSVLALGMAAMLEKAGYSGKIVFLDGSPNLMKTTLNKFMINSRAAFEVGIISFILSIVLPSTEVLNITEKLIRLEDFESRRKLALKILPDNLEISKEILLEIGQNLYDLTFILHNYEPSSEKVAANILLCVPTMKVLKNFPEDLELSSYCSSTIQIETVEGAHLSILENTEMFVHINNFIEA